jgi:quinoprotein glucose dehydrogenase
VIDFTPPLRAEAMEMLSQYRVGGPFMPRLYEDHNTGVEDNIRCYGGLNITSPATLDPSTGILYVPSSRGCSGGSIIPGQDVDQPDNPATTGTTISQWVAGPGGGLPRVQGLPAWKPPYNRVSAYDMNTGERIWWIPIGQVPENIANHPALRNVDTSGFGGGGNSINMVAGDLLYTTEGSGGAPVLNAWNKLTGEYVGQVEMPGSGQYGMMTYSHDGQQTIVVQVGQPARLVALRLPASGGGGRGGGGRGGGPGGL